MSRISRPTPSPRKVIRPFADIVTELVKSPSVSVSIGHCPASLTASLSPTTVVAQNPAYITGRVLDEVGNPVKGLVVNAYTQTVDPTTSTVNKTIINSSTTDSNGNYSIQISFSVPGSYDVFTEVYGTATCGPIEHGAVTLTVNPGQQGGGPRTFALQGTPTISGTNITLTYKNTYSMPLSGIVEADIRNQLGQTVAVATGSLNAVPAGGTAQATISLAGIAPGTYAVSIFVIDQSGVALANSYTVSVTVS